MGSYLIKIFKIFAAISFFSLISASIDSFSNSIPKGDYVSDSSGNIYIYVNVMGHVKNPGSYLIHEDSDLMTIIAQAGGMKLGANLKKIKILNARGESEIIIDLDKYLNSKTQLNFDIHPNDTVYINQTTSSFLLSKVNILNSILQILNIYLTIKN